MSIRNYDPLNEQDRELPVGESLARKAAQCGDESAKPALRWTAGPYLMWALPDRFRVVAYDGGHAVADLEFCNNAPRSEIEATATLLSAAPELASALQALTESISFTGQAATLVTKDIRERHTAARAALRKAGAL